MMRKYVPGMIVGVCEYWPEIMVVVCILVLHATLCRKLG